LFSRSRINSIFSYNMDRFFDVNDEADDNWLLLFMLFGLWLFLRSFTGFSHDGIIYAFQSYALGKPHLLENDLLLRYFNQGDLSFFTNVYSWFIEKFGLSEGALILFRLSHVVWFFALFFLVKTCDLNYFLSLAVMVTVCFAGGQYVDNVFVVGERFLTSRVLAEGLTFLSLGLLLRHYWLASIVVGLLATAMHPLIGGWFFALALSIVFIRAEGFRALLLLAVASTLSISLAVVWLLDYSEFIGELSAADRIQYLLISKWDLSNFGRVFIQLSLLSAVLLIPLNTTIRYYFHSIIVLCFVTLFLTAIADLFRLELFIKLQFWRFFYISYIASIIATFILLADMVKAGRYSLLLLLCSLWLADGLGCLVLGALVVFSVYSYRTGWNQQVLSDKRFVFIIVSVIALQLVELIATFSAWWDSELFIGGIIPHREYLGKPLLVIALILLLFLRDKRYRLISFALGTIFYYWHFSNSQELDVNSPNKSVVSSLQATIAPDELVYWPENYRVVWFTIDRPVYFEMQQMVPSVFSRELFYEGQRRKAQIDKLKTIDSTQEYLMTLCSDSILSWVIIDSNDFIGEYTFMLNKIEYTLVNCRSVNASETYISGYKI
jgi:hypothetical protein